MVRKSMKFVSILVIAAFAVQSFISPKVLANPGDQVKSTQILLLDTPGTKVTWNTTANLGVRLISSEDGQPIQGQNLSLNLNESLSDGGWNLTLLAAKITGADGIANFSFFVDMIDGVYNYTVIFPGDGLYLPASNASHFIVTGDPEPSFYCTVTNFQATVEGASLHYDTAIAPPANQWEGIFYHTFYNAKIERVDISFTVLKAGIPYGLYASTSIPESSGSASGSFNAVHFTDSYHVTDYTLADIKWMPGYYRVEANVFVVGSYIDTTWYGFIPVDTTVRTSRGWSSSTETISTPNTTPPQPYGYAFDKSVTLQQQVPYNLYCTYADPYGWTGNFRYKFNYPNGTESAVFEVDGANSTALTTPTKLSYGIPYGTWSQFVGSTVFFSTQAIDNYNPPSEHSPGGWPQARLSTDWTDWHKAGTIFSNPGGDIFSVEAWGQLGTTAWISQPIGLNYPMYVDDPNFITVEIVNPNLDTDMNITYPTLSFSSAFGGYGLTTQDITSYLINAGATLNYDGNISIHPGVCSVIIKKIFALSDFTGLYGQYNLLDTPHDITIQFSFSYSSTLYQYSTECPIIRPLAPSVEFLGFSGYKEGGNYVFRDLYGKATVQIQYRITNNARIPIQSSHSFSYSPTETEDTTKIPLQPTPTSTSQLKDVPGLASTEVIYSIKFNNPNFFLDEDQIVSLIIASAVKYGSLIVAIIKAGSVAEGVKATSTAVVGIIFNLLLFAYYTEVTMESQFSFRQSWSYQPFNMGTTWTYFHYGTPAPPTNDYQHFGYSELQTLTTPLNVAPSGLQVTEFNIGIILRYTATVLYLLSVIMYFFPLLAGVATVLSIAGDALILASKILWWAAKDDVLPNENYSSVFVPEYISNNASKATPASEFDASALSLVNSSIKLTGDLVAVNETQSRQAGAVANGDYSAAAMQDDALANYSQMVAEDYGNVQNNLGVVTTLVAQNASEIMNSSQDIETSIGINGVTPANVAELEAAGLNQSDISLLNQTIVDTSKAGTFSANISTIIPTMVATYNSSVPLVNSQIEQFENVSSAATADSVTIKVDKLGETILTADTATISTLSALNSSMYDNYVAGNWQGAIVVADQLVVLARNTTTWTNNQSYILSYGQEAQTLKHNAQQNLAIALQHVPSITVTPGESMTVTLVVRSDGAPSGSYLFETNSSWVGQNGTSITVTRFNSVSLPLQILVGTSPPTTPGIYAVKLRVSLPGTTTVVDSILLVTVKPFYNFTATLNAINNTGSPGANLSFIATIQNLGNVNDTYTIWVQQKSLPAGFPADPLQIPDSWGGLSTNVIRLDAGESAAVSFNITVPMDWIGFNDTTYPFVLNVLSAGNPQLNAAIVSNITIRATPLSSMRWVQVAIDALDLKLDNLTRYQVTRPCWDFTSRHHGGHTCTSFRQQAILRSLERWIDRAQVDVEVAVAMLNGTIPTSFNATRVATYLTVTALRNIGHFLNGMTILNRTTPGGLGEDLLQVMVQGIYVKNLLMNMLNKLIPGSEDVGTHPPSIQLRGLLLSTYIHSGCHNGVSDSAGGDIYHRIAHFTTYLFYSGNS